jgi:hypothetical protein
VEAELSRPYDATGASKVSPTICVLTTAATVKLKSADALNAGLLLHAADVPDVQAAVKHEPSASSLLVVKSCVPKFRPVTVTDVKPVGAVFPRLCETRGESSVNAVCEVPATAPSVIVRMDSMSAATPVRHFTLVPVVHEAVKHSACASLDDAVKSSPPKFKPRIETD